MSALSESPVPEIGTPGSMSGVWKRGYGEGTRAPPDERGGKQTTQTYGRRATSRLYIFFREPLIGVCFCSRNWHYKSMSKGSRVGASS